MNPPSTTKKILAVVAGIIITALTAALVFFLLESIFGAAERTGAEQDKYRIFSSKASWSFFIALFIAGFTGAITCLAIAKANLLNLALITALTPLALVTLSLLFNKEGKKPGAATLIMAAVLAAGALLAWFVKKPVASNQTGS